MFFYFPTTAEQNLERPIKHFFFFCIFVFCMVKTNPCTVNSYNFILKYIFEFDNQNLNILAIPKRGILGCGYCEYSFYVTCTTKKYIFYYILRKGCVPTVLCLWCYNKYVAS